jgi:hypothetical protein
MAKRKRNGPLVEESRLPWQLRRFVKELRESAADELKWADASQPYEIEDYIEAEGGGVDNSIQECKRVYLAIIDCFDRFQHRPWPEQREMMMAMLNSSVPTLFQDQWATKKDLIMETLGLTEYDVNNLCAISTPRQFGKTTAMAYLVAAILYVKRTIFRVGLPAISQDIAEKNLRDVATAFMTLAENQGARLHYSKKQMIITWPSGQYSLAKSAPQSEQAMRGQAFDFLMVDEAGFLSDHFMEVAIYPLMRKADRTVVCISTPPEDSCDPFAKILTAKLDGKLIFKVLIIRNMCDSCVAEHKKECPHVEKISPPFNNVQSERMLAALYKSIARFEREILGAQASNSLPAFILADIERWANREPVVFPKERSRRFVLFAIDPGATRSNTAIVAMCLSDQSDRVVTREGCLFIDVKD